MNLDEAAKLVAANAGPAIARCLSDAISTGVEMSVVEANMISSIDHCIHWAFKQIDVGGDEFYHNAAVLAMGAVWWKYIKFIPENLREEYKEYLISGIEGELKTAAALFGRKVEHELRADATHAFQEKAITAPVSIN